MCTMFVSPSVGVITRTKLYILWPTISEWLIWHVLAGAPCEGIKVPVKGLGAMMMHMFCLDIYAYCGVI